MKTLLRGLFQTAALGSCVTLTQATSPSVSITREGGRVAITFSGTLEGADQITGPWLALTNVISPFSEETGHLQRFYRAKEEGASIFSSSSVITWTLSGPFQANFNLAHAGTPDGIIPPKRLKPYFNAQLQMGDLHLPVTMRVRGNSSLQECSFPKMKLKVSKEDRAGTPFADAREIKIGTHCAEGGHGNIGRLRDERAAWREALAYEVMDLLGFTSPRVRRAVIEYHDNGLPDEFSTSGWVVTRHALISDDIELVASRLGGRALSDAEIEAITKTPFSAQLVLDLKLLHALLGNWDYSVEAETRGLWNTDVVELADKSLLPVAGDFDLASFVTASVRLSTPAEYHPELADVERQALYTVENLRATVASELFAAGRDRFLQHRVALETRINQAEVDDAGRANALRHVNAFFNALSPAASGGPR